MNADDEWYDVQKMLDLAEEMQEKIDRSSRLSMVGESLFTLLAAASLGGAAFLTFNPKTRGSIDPAYYVAWTLALTASLFQWLQRRSMNRRVFRREGRAMVRVLDLLHEVDASLNLSKLQKAELRIRLARLDMTASPGEGLISRTLRVLLQTVPSPGSPRQRDPYDRTGPHP
ncbi:hypothetical protein AB0G76_03070 [Streptomyces asoensis]|uniref:hypothetical protein n=1 Tax=Streptomyces asoensis TaxID=249586 RepID=UPI0033D0AED6